MIEVEEQQEVMHLERIIGHIKGEEPGPTIIMVGGIHGNEPGGVKALQEVVQEIQDKQLRIKGNFYAISGNLWALRRGERYYKHDLNRLWTEERVTALKKGDVDLNDEDIKQQKEICDLIVSILENEQGPYYFMDLHTTSSPTIPFLTVNDSLLNRKYTQQYPVPLILGIEEYLDGPLLSYINELGYVAFGFEGGQHDDPGAIENHVAFCWLSLVFAGALSKKDIPFDNYYYHLHEATKSQQNVFEIFYRYEVKEGEEFRMKPGYVNFEAISEGQELATSNGEVIRASRDGQIFMPLYQNKGNDGFFGIQVVPRIFLNLSAFLRKIRFDKILPWLPGISWTSSKKDEMVVNRRITRFFARQFFHLLGYRSKRFDRDYLIIKNREAASRTKEYKGAPWLN